VTFRNAAHPLRPGRLSSLARSILVAGYVLILVSGCPKHPKIAPPLIPGTGDVEISTDEVIARLTDRRDQFRSLTGMGKVGIQSWEERYRFSEIFVLRKPARFRLETLGFLDQPAVFLTSDEAMLSLYTKKHNTYYRGVASQENLFKLSGLNLSVEDAIFVLSGNAPRLSEVNSEWGLPLPHIQTYYVERTSLRDNRVQRIWFDTTIDAISNIQEYMLTNGELVLDIAFDDYRAAAGQYPIPASILIDRPLDHTRVQITYQSFEVNPVLDQTVFQFTPPDNAKVYFLDDVTAEDLEHLAPYKEFRVQE
jgi:outer membrane lipoprotein-sorting protein